MTGGFGGQGWQAGKGQAEDGEAVVSSSGCRGMIVGALVGCLIAFANWSGETMQAAQYVIVAAATGWLIGYQIGKNRST